MKTIKNFQEKKITKEQISLVIGCQEWTETHFDAYLREDGCIITKSDKYIDRDGDGIHSCDEVYQETTRVTCNDPCYT